DVAVHGLPQRIVHPVTLGVSEVVRFSKILLIAQPTVVYIIPPSGAERKLLPASRLKRCIRPDQGRTHVVGVAVIDGFLEGAVFSGPVQSVMTTTQYHYHSECQ